MYCTGVPLCPRGRPIGINLSREVRQEAERSVGAREVDGGLGGGRVPARCEPDERVRGRRKRPNPSSSSTPAPTDGEGLGLRLMLIGRASRSPWLSITDPADGFCIEQEVESMAGASPAMQKMKRTPQTGY